MALDTERDSTQRSGYPWGVLMAGIARLGPIAARARSSLAVVGDRMPATVPGGSGIIRIADAAGGWRARLGGAFKGSWLYRLVTSTLARRIFIANLLGLLVLLLGMIWLSEHQSWLITAKRESLRVQGEIIAAAIAGNASADQTGITLDPERLSETETMRVPFRDDSFAAFELTLPPEKIGRFVRRLI